MLLLPAVCDIISQNALVREAEGVHVEWNRSKTVSFILARAKRHQNGRFRSVNRIVMIRREVFSHRQSAAA
ncbi:hypothetical protein AB1L42_06820 [Thalassoglobus sp. JC818]|uniref:hypothetical protein n=1 Tax=Thalassoglobus sp. JC818 TaxID=3232136 RepID=UPI003459B639